MTPSSGGISDYSEVGATFSAIVSELHPSLFKMALAITANPAVAEDALAGAYASSWARFRKGGVAELDRYLWRAVARQARRSSFLHRRAPVVMVIRAPKDPAEIVSSSSEVAGLLSQLPENQRTVLALRYLSGFSESEVADLLGIRLGTVKSRISRAATTLRERAGPPGHPTRAGLPQTASGRDPSEGVHHA